MKKVILTIGLCFTLVLGVTGCNNIGNDAGEYRNAYEIVENVDKSYLFQFNNIVYGKSYGTLDYVGGKKPIGTIKKQIDSTYIPRKDGETNNKDLVGVKIHEANNDAAVVSFNGEYVLFEAIKE